MDLHLTHIRLKNFRSYKSFELHELGPLTILVGPNAIGKTNIIEAIQLITTHTSFRNPLIRQLLHIDTEKGSVIANVTDSNRHLELELLLSEGKKSFLLNKKLKKTAELKGLIPSVVFTPDDLNLIKGPMSARRNIFDYLGFQLSKNHYLIYKDYEKVIKHKNKMLKEGSSSLMLDSIDEMVVTCGAQLCCYRYFLFKKMMTYISQYYEEITQGRETLSACYIPSWCEYNSEVNMSIDFDRDEARVHLEEALKKERKKEIERKRSSIGPHVDKIEFFIDSKNASIYGSQGQQRSIVLAIKLAEVALIQEILNQKPLLLLDDVMSELDESRRNALIKLIIGDIQTFITTTNLLYFDELLLDKAQIIDLTPGRDKEVE